MWGLYIIIFSTVLYLLIHFRNEYTLKRMEEARILISKYNQKLLKNKKYDITIDYYNDMIIDYNEYLISLNLWGKYSAIKPEYKNILLI